MATQVPPLRDAVFTMSVAFTSQADTNIFQTTVTLAAGDIKVSKDGAGFNNIGTLPTEIAATGVLPVAFTANEMDADIVVLLCHDAAGAEWQDLLVVLHTVTVNQIDDLSTPATGADAVWDEATAGHAIAGSFAENQLLHALTSELPARASRAIPGVRGDW